MYMNIADTSSVSECSVKSSHYFIISDVFKWFVSHTPYLIHESSITPHITSSGVLLVVESLEK